MSPFPSFFCLPKPPFTSSFPCHSLQVTVLISSSTTLLLFFPFFFRCYEVLSICMKFFLSVWSSFSLYLFLGELSTLGSLHLSSISLSQDSPPNDSLVHTLSHSFISSSRRSFFHKKRKTSRYLYLSLYHSIPLGIESTEKRRKSVRLNSHPSCFLPLDYSSFFPMLIWHRNSTSFFFFLLALSSLFHIHLHFLPLHSTLDPHPLAGPSNDFNHIQCIGSDRSSVEFGRFHQGTK